MNHNNVTHIRRNPTRDIYSLQVECADGIDADRLLRAIESLENFAITPENVQFFVHALLANRASVTVRHLMRRQDDACGMSFETVPDQEWSRSEPAA